MTVAYELGRCPVCTGADCREIADAQAIRAEVELLWEFHGRRLRPETPPQRLVDRVAFSQRPPRRVVRCHACDTVYRNPREREVELRKAYAAESPTEDAMLALLDTQRATYDAQARRLTRVAAHAGIRPGRGLEVGSYVGGFLGAAAPHGWRFEGIDVNPTVNAFARERGFIVHDGTLDAVDGEFAAVAIWNCLDQLHDPRDTLLAARRLLGSRGLLAVRVPNGRFYSILRTRLAGTLAPVARTLLAHSNLLGFPYRQAFSADGLRLLLGTCGFDLIDVVGDALVPIADEWTRGWAALEERVFKRALRLLGSANAAGAPWLEAYAVAPRSPKD